MLLDLQAGRHRDALEFGGPGRGRGGGEGEHGGRGILHGPDHTTPARTPREDPERQHGGDEVQTDAVGQVPHEQAAEHEGGERHREHRLDGADDHAGGEHAQPARGSSLLGHRLPSS